MTEILPATAELLERFWGAPPAGSARAMVVVRDGEPIAVAGVYAQAQCWVAFLEIKPEARAEIKRRPRVLLEAARRVLSIAGRRSMPVHAAAQDGIDGAERFLEHLGFERRGPIYEWRP